jgi:hypothetical protein
MESRVDSVAPVLDHGGTGKGGQFVRHGAPLVRRDSQQITAVRIDVAMSARNDLQAGVAGARAIAVLGVIGFL